MTTPATHSSRPDHSDDGLVAHRVALVTGGTRGIGAADRQVRRRPEGRPAVRPGRDGGRYALVTMCIGGGQGIAALFEPL